MRNSADSVGAEEPSAAVVSVIVLGTAETWLLTVKVSRIGCAKWAWMILVEPDEVD